MDCNMPIMDGYDATKEIRKFIHNAELPQPIISAVTGHSE
jgi:CheY-like chemotaxis protein